MFSGSLSLVASWVMPVLFPLFPSLFLKSILMVSEGRNNSLAGSSHLGHPALDMWIIKGDFWGTNFKIFMKSNLSTFSLVTCVFVFIFKELLPNPRSCRFITVVPLNSYILGLWSIWNCFFLCVRYGSNCILLHVAIQLFQHQLLKKLFFPPLNGLRILVKNQLTIDTWVYFWTFHFIPLTVCLFYARTKLFWLLQLSSKFWSEEVRVLQPCSFSQLLYLTCFRAPVGLVETLWDMHWDLMHPPAQSSFLPFSFTCVNPQ